MGSGRGATRRVMAVMAEKEASYDLRPVTTAPLAVFTPVELYSGGNGVIISSDLQSDGTIEYGVRCDAGNTYSQLKAVEDFNPVPGFVWGDEEESYRERNILGQVVYLEHGNSGVVFPGQVVSVEPTHEALQGGGGIRQEDLRVTLYFYETLPGSVRGPFELGEVRRTRSALEQLVVDRVTF